MKDTKYMLNDNDLYDYHRIQEKLTRLAAEGWHLEKITNLLWKFRRGEPKQVRYAITYSAAASAYNSRPTAEEEALADLCAEAGWELAAAYAQVQIFRNENPDATPLETDELQKYRNIRRNMMWHQIPQQLLMIAVFALQFLMFGSSLMREPASILSSTMMVFVLAGSAGIVIEHAALLCCNLLWLLRGRLAVHAGSSIPPNLFYRRFRWVMWATSALYILGLLFCVEPAFGLSTLILAVVAAVISLGTLALTKKFNASRRVNIWVPALVAMAVILSSRPLLSGVLTPAEPPAEFPLTLTQLTGENSADRLTIDVDSSPLVSHGRYYDFGAVNQIQYTLVDVHCPLFYDMILNDLEQGFLQSRFYAGDAVLSEGLRESIGADYLRRTYGFTNDLLLLCWDERIVFFYANWILTDDQLTAAAAALKP